MVDNGAIAEVGAEEFYCVVASGVAVEMKRDAAEAVFCDAVERAAAKGNGV